MIPHITTGIFFSKDRKEEVIEVEEEPVVEYIPEAREHVKLMTQGQWMKGCPEGGEQSFLFGLYSELSEGACQCPQGCNTSFARKKSDFFAIFVSFNQLMRIPRSLDRLFQSDFNTYIDRLSNSVRKTCSTCQTEFCFACGEPISADKPKRPSAASRDDPLFHCSNLQGVILGIGLFMLEQLFVEQIHDSPDGSAENEKTRTTKRRKTDSSAPKEPDDDDDVYYTGVKGAKLKGGIGYAGDIKEDVRNYEDYRAHSMSLTCFNSIPAKLKHLRSSIRRTPIFLSSSVQCGYTYPHSAGQEEVRPVIISFILPHWHTFVGVSTTCAAHSSGTIRWQTCQTAPFSILSC